MEHLGLLLCLFSFPPYFEMEIKLINKNTGKLSGIIRSSDINKGCFIDLQYTGKKEVFKDIQEVLLKYFILKSFRKGGNHRSPILLPEVTEHQAPKHGLAWNRSKEVNEKW